MDKISGIQAMVRKQLTTVQLVQRRTYVNLIIKKCLHEYISTKEFPIHFHKVLARDVESSHISNKAFREK